MFWEPRGVPGTDLEVRPLSAAQMLAFIRDEGDESEKLVRLAALSAYRGDAPAWTVDDAMGEPFPLIKAVADIALQLNGLGENPVEDAAGN